MRFLSRVILISMLGATISFGQGHPTPASPAKLVWMQDSQDKLSQELVSKYGGAERDRITRGLRQVADFWRAEDGDAAAFQQFVRTNFAGDPPALDPIFNRFEGMLEQLDGHMTEIRRAFHQQTDMDRGPILPFDETFASYDPAAHVPDDFFSNKLAFVVLLNFPVRSLNEYLTEGPTWTRREWAEARLAEDFSKRLPADVNLAIAQAAAEAEEYISQYNIWVYHLVDGQGQRSFPPKLRLLSHWNLRDEIKADYSDPQNGLAKQRTIEQVMDRIVTQTIPQIVVNNPKVDWNPFTNEVKPAAETDSDAPARPQGTISNAPEPCTRYQMLLRTFQASQRADPYSPTAPTLMDRRFNKEREIPEKRVEEMLVQVLSSPLVPKVAQIIQSRLGRPLEPFDIWYDGFLPRSTYPQADLDAIVSKRYPTAQAYQKDIPNILIKLGFSPEKAQYLADNIRVEPARGSGYAWGAEMRSAKALLLTRVEKTGMNYKGFNIAVHEMGHNVEQTFSLNEIDHTLLQGVPNNAFTEALAMLLQGHDLEVLGLSAPDEKSEAFKVLNDFWNAYEISGAALVDMAVWHWMYGHPDATADQLRDATVQMSKNTWNRYYAPVFGKKDAVLLGIYSHMIDYMLYLPDYPIGHLIGFQIEEQMRKAGKLGDEFERMAIEGRVTPDMWMINATGKPVGAEALLAATERSLAKVQKEGGSPVR